ncbi:MAG: hypothetical protein V4641_05745 [Pseudomonadota bacterium]
MSKRMYRLTLIIDVPTEGNNEPEHRNSLMTTVFLRTGMAAGTLSRHIDSVLDEKPINLTLPGETQSFGTANIERYRSAG